MAIGARLRELARRYPLLPGSWLEMVVITHGVSELGLEILQLLVPIVVQQPVEGFLVVRTVVVSLQWRYLAESTYASQVSFNSRSCSLNMCHMDRSCRSSWGSISCRGTGLY